MGYGKALTLREALVMGIFRMDLDGSVDGYLYSFLFCESIRRALLTSGGCGNPDAPTPSTCRKHSCSFESGSRLSSRKSNRNGIRLNLITMNWRTGVDMFMNLLFFLLVLLAKPNVECTDTFKEELFVSPLRTDEHSDFFPKPVLDIYQRHSVDEFHVRLTQGYFRNYKWGYPIIPAPTGGEVWAWFSETANSNSSIPERWHGLSNSLAGLFCATFNDIESANSMSPVYLFHPEGLSSPVSRNNSFLRYSMLPRENLCTENLTPWKKLLPCYDRSGLSKLLNAVKLLSSHYFSLALDVKPVCADETSNCADKVLQLEMSATTVIQPSSIQDSNKFDWSLRDLLEMDLDSSCPLASSSLVYVDQTLSEQMVFWPEAHERSHRTAIYDLKKQPSLQFGGKSISKLDYKPIDSPQVTIHRFVSGSGQQSGGLQAVISNHDKFEAVKISYLEIIPWYLRVYFHTIKVNKGSEDIDILKRHLVPARDRISPHQIQLIFDIPADSTVEFSVSFDYTLLKWTEYPPDANHGFEIPASVLSAKLTSCDQKLFRKANSSCYLRLYSEALLLNIPTPDFSMPYNVICMTCTVLALAFGPIHALTTKNFHPVDPKKNPVLLIRIKEKVVGTLKKILRRT